MTPTILVVGSLNMDLVVRAEHIPGPGQTLIGHDFQTVPGGKGANQAVAAARLGAKTYMVGRVGGDSFGSALVEALEESRVTTDYLEIDEMEANGVALILVDDQGENSIVVAPGANGKVTPHDVRSAEAAWAEASHVVLQLEIPLDAVECTLDTAREKGVTSVLDAGPAMKVPMELLRKADILSPNESETEALIGRRVTDLDSARDAAKCFLDNGIGTVVLKLGDEGCLVATASDMTHVPAHKVKAVDTTAAGDAFTAALAVSLAEGKFLLDAAHYAAAVGAIAVTCFGAQPSLPTREVVERFIASRT
ncbi:MAG: ribokinase [Planctomycetes bacterium]|nr:ribokinase [Planctomycetota bacterium]